MIQSDRTNPRNIPTNQSHLQRQTKILLRIKGLRKNKITFYPSRLQAIFARSGGGEILKRACYSSGFATTGSNKSNPNPDAWNVILFFRGP
jgi:hypothetical protein